MNVVAIVVTYNRKELLRECIRALLNQNPITPDIMVIDNASSDGTYDSLASFICDEDIIYYNTGENLGGAGGFNFGIKEAVKRGYEYLWVMDDDTWPESDALKKLMEADSVLGGKYGWLSSVALWTDGTECKMNRHKITRRYYRYSPLIKHGIVQAEQATFVSMFIRSKVICNHGLPIKEFFIWGDDIEFSRRISVRAGLPCFIVGQSQVVHAMKENKGSNIAIDNVDRIERYNYAFRNESYLYRQEGIKGFLYYVAKCALNIWRVITVADNRKLKRLSIIMKQLCLGLFFNPQVEYPNEKTKN